MALDKSIYWGFVFAIIGGIFSGILISTAQPLFADNLPLAIFLLIIIALIFLFVFKFLEPIILKIREKNRSVVKKILGRCLEGLGIGVVAGSIVGNPITASSYWYFLGSGTIVMLIGILLVENK